MTDDDQGEFVYLLALKAYTDPNKPTDIERLITELKNTQTALYYHAAVLREMDTSNLIRRDD